MSDAAPQLPTNVEVLQALLVRARAERDAALKRQSCQDHRIIIITSMIATKLQEECDRMTTTVDPLHQRSTPNSKPRQKT